MSDEKMPSVHECLAGIDSSLGSIAESLEGLHLLFEGVLAGDGDKLSGIVGKAGSQWAQYQFIRTSEIGD